MPWMDKEDLRWFRDMTRDSVVVLGRRTFETTRCWPDREKHLMLRAETPEEVMSRYADRDYIWVGGGAVIYALWMPYVRRSFITRVDYDGPADSWMPPLWSQDKT